jgi:hypothetical protein
MRNTLTRTVGRWITSMTVERGAQRQRAPRVLVLAVAVATAVWLTALPASAAGSATTKVWVGAPYTGYWPGSPNPTDALPKYHDPLFTVYGQNYTHDWAMDYYAPAGTGVRLYAAPKDSALGSQITAKVVYIQPTCRSGSVSSGGYAVHIAIYHSGVQVGSIVYGHVQPDFNKDGATTSADTGYRKGIARWGGYIGTVGKYTKNPCWDVSGTSGHHTHVELGNIKNFACYRPGVAQHARIAEHEYIGYLGGAFASAKKQACPSGA